MEPPIALLNNFRYFNRDETYALIRTIATRNTVAEGGTNLLREEVLLNSAPVCSETKVAMGRLSPMKAKQKPESM